MSCINGVNKNSYCDEDGFEGMSEVEEIEDEVECPVCKCMVYESDFDIFEGCCIICEDSY